LKTVVISKYNFDKLKLAFDKLVSDDYYNNNQMNPDYKELKTLLFNIKKDLEKVELENCSIALHNPISTIINEIILILEDGKVNLRDIGNFSNIISELFKLRDAVPKINKELSSLSRAEYQTIAAEIAGFVYDKAKGIK